jgi:hypothetical protein
MATKSLTHEVIARDRKATVWRWSGRVALALAVVAASAVVMAGALPALADESFPRGVYGIDSSPSGSDLMEALGFNVVEVGPYREELDGLQARGLRAMVWLGRWESHLCNFARDDDWVAQTLLPIAGHPAIFMYVLGDEPAAGECPDGPAIYRARTELVHLIDPGHPTFTAIPDQDPWLGEWHPYRHWVGAVDIIGVDIYPCRVREECEYAKIDAALSALEQQGVPRYLAILQAFSAERSGYRLPTAEEVQQQFLGWRPSRMEGYFVYTWHSDVDLEDHPDILAALASENQDARTR